MMVHMKTRMIFILTFLLLASSLEAQLSLKEQREMKRLYNDGVERMINGDYAGSVNSFDQCLAIDSNFSQACLQRGRVEASLGENQRAIADLDQAIHYDPGSGEAHFYAGYLMFGEDTAGRAEEYLRQALSLGFENAELHYCLGLIDLLLGNDDVALLQFNKAINMKDDFALAYHDRAGIKWKMGDRLGALYDYKAAVNYMQVFPLAYNNMGAVKMTLGDYEGAINDFTKALDQDPDLYLAYNNRGFANYQLGGLDTALTDFNEAMKHHADFVEARLNASSVLARQNELDDAVEMLDQVIGMHPEEGVLFLNRGLIKEMKGDLVGACNDWNRALELGQKQAASFLEECK